MKHSESRVPVIVAYGRSAVCRGKNGSFTGIHPIAWTAQVLTGVLEQLPGLDPSDIDDIILGCARHENRCNKNMARLVSLHAGLPYSIPAQTINRFCSSGLQSIATASNAILAGESDVIIAGGVEQMSMKLTRADDDDYPPLHGNEPGAYMPMGITAENVASKYNITREEMDVFAASSHQKAARAQDLGYLGSSIIPVSVTDKYGNQKTADKDEGIRPGTTPETLSTLKPCFLENGLVTAATSSQVSDGAAFCVIMSTEKAQKLGIKPVAKLIKHAAAGCDPQYMGLGPLFAVPKLMTKLDLAMSYIDVIELNEAFAAQAIPCIHELGLPEEKVNPWGGAIALGHPMGATGIILMCKALDYLRVTGGHYAMVTMCIGGGMGAAGIFELLDK